jgi:hypothetical protein
LAVVGFSAAASAAGSLRRAERLAEEREWWLGTMTKEQATMTQGL